MLYENFRWLKSSPRVELSMKIARLHLPQTGFILKGGIELRFLLNLVLFQIYVFDAARRLRVYPLPVFPSKMKKNVKGRYVPYLCILVSKSKLISFDINTIRKIVFHEMRHHWQVLNYRELCYWWIDHKEEYMRYYHSPLNWMEEDARCFSLRGRRSEQNDPPTVEDLERWYQRGLL